MSPWTAAAVGALVALLPWTWAPARHVVTLVHEGGHALVAVLTGRRLSGIRLHRDTSGLTTSVGRPRGPGMVATAAAGYLAPTLLGLLGLWLATLDRAAWSLWVFLAALAAMLLFIRNWFGLLVVLVAGLVVAGLVWRTDEPTQRLAAVAFAAFLLVGGPRTTLELWASRRAQRGRGTTDADVLARLTHVPAGAWNLLLVVATAGALWPAWRWLADLGGT